jgi:hypothetical protein
MASDVHVQNLAPIVANNKEAIQQVESDRWDGEEIHGGDRIAVIANKGLPAPGQVWISQGSLHPTGDASLGYIEAQHEELAVDAGSTPGWVFRHHPEDQIPNFRRQSFSTDLVFHLRDQAPVESKSDTMPADDSFRRNDDERTLPSGPEPVHEHPEEFVQEADLWSAVFAF